MKKNDFIIFNAYTNRGRVQLRDLAYALSSLLGYPEPIQQSFGLTGQRSNSYAERPSLYVNGGSGYLISPKPEQLRSTGWYSDVDGDQTRAIHERMLGNDTGRKPFMPEWWRDSLTGEQYSSHDGVWETVFLAPVASQDEGIPPFHVRHFNTATERDEVLDYGTLTEMSNVGFYMYKAGVLEGLLDVANTPA